MNILQTLNNNYCVYSITQKIKRKPQFINNSLVM